MLKVLLEGAVIAQGDPAQLVRYMETEGFPAAADVSQLLQWQCAENRRLAYAAESDPLYMEWQYDQTAEAEQAWRDKVAEIKARYPLPVE